MCSETDFTQEEVIFIQLQELPFLPTAALSQNGQKTQKAVKQRLQNIHFLTTPLEGDTILIGLDLVIDIWRDR